jgi:F-type H+-transporting ATPase subunit b
MLRNTFPVLPILLVCGLYMGMFGAANALAQEHGKTGHGESNSDPAVVVQEQHPVDPHATHKAGAETVAHGDNTAHAQDTHVADSHNGEAGDVHGEDHGGGHAAPMVTGTKLWDLLWRTLNFAALVFLLVKFGGRPVAAFLGGRRREIQDELKTLEEQRNDAERSYREFEIRLAGMEEEMAGVVEKALTMAEEEKARILAEAEAAADDIKRQAEAAVQGALANARSKLQEEVAEQAVAMAEELIVKNLTAKDQVAITEQYLEKVGAVQ